MFRRRNKPTSLQRLRNAIWPSAGWLRSSRYFAHRVARLPGSPYSIASGFAIGAAVSFTPFIGFHFVLSAAFAFLLRSNIMASLLGTIVGNPWTFPFIWLWIYKCGNWLLGANLPGEKVHFNMAVLWDFVVLGVNYIGRGVIFGLWSAADKAHLGQLWISIVDIIWPMIVGSLPSALIVWIIFYFPIRRAVIIYRQNRIIRRMKKSERRALALRKNHHEMPQESSPVETDGQKKQDALK